MVGDALRFVGNEIISGLMDAHHRFGPQFLLISVVLIFSGIELSSDNPGNHLVENGNLDIIGCTPCSQEYLISSYSDNHSSPDFLAQELRSDGVCNGPEDLISGFWNLVVHQHLNGEGSHRQLVLNISFDVQLDDIQWFSTHFCEVVMIERLPIGFFADPFELQLLVRRGLFRNAAVFGDTNLELPSTLSNRSAVEVHMNVQHCVAHRRCVILVELPLHSRYPPFDAGGYARVNLGAPDMFIRFRQKGIQQEACSWAVGNMDLKSGNSITWQVPCGNDMHTVAVSSITFGLALVCALLIVVSSIYFSAKNTKGS